MNLYLCGYIVAWTECNNRHKYYHINPHNSEFMDIFWQANRYERQGRELCLQICLK